LGENARLWLGVFAFGCVEELQSTAGSSFLIN